MASTGNQHCANCIGTLLFPVAMNRRRGKDVNSNLLVGGSRI